MKRNKLIVVLGMHRSGTSAITRGLQIMGVELGDKLMLAVDGNNDKGFWEDLDLNALNIEMLDAIGSDWHYLAPVEPRDVLTLLEKGFLHRADVLLRQKMDNIPVFGFKDPRVAKLLPFWREVFDHCDYDVSYVLVLRHPLSVAKSLAERDGFDVEKSYLLWLGHVIACFSILTSDKRVLVDYDRMMQSPDRELNRIAQSLDLEIQAEELQSYKTVFLDEGLRHTVYDANCLLLEEDCPPIVIEIYSALLDIASDKVKFEDVQLQDQVARWTKEFERYKSPLVLVDKLCSHYAEYMVKIEDLNQIVIERNGHIEDLKRVVAERDGRIESLHLDVAEKIAEFNQMIEDRDGLIDNANRAVTDRDGRIENLHHDVDERDNEIAAFKAKLTERDEQVEKLQASLHHAENTVSLVTNSTSWRMTSGLRWLGSRLRAISPLQATRYLVTGDFTRKLFSVLPVSMKTKRVIKDIVFRYAGFLFKGAPAFQIWQEKQKIKQARKTLSQDSQYDNTAPAGPVEKRMLIIDATTPTPDCDSGSLDVVYFMKAFLELGYDITFIPDDLQPLGEYTEDLGKLGVRCLTYVEIDSVEDFLRREGSGLGIVLLYRVHTARLHVADVKKYAPNAKVIFDTVDLHFLREERQALIDGSGEARESADYTRKAEFEMMQVADATIVLSDVERNLVFGQDPFLNIFTIPYMREVPGCKNTYEQRRDILFIGGFRHMPNVDGIKYFVNEIWPLIRNKLDDAKLLVLGSNPTDEVIALGNDDPRIEVVGFVEELADYFDAARLSIAPLRFGAGIKGKIGTSASYGVPCVATTLAVEGMGLTDGVNILVADTPELFAEKVATLYEDEKLWSQISASSVDFLQQNYSYDAGKYRLERLLKSLSTGFCAIEILDFNEIENLSEYRIYKEKSKAEYHRRLELERSLVGDEQGFVVKGYCAVCRNNSAFYVDYKYAFTDDNGKKSPNWRESLVCVRCELNNRVRAAIHLFLQECAPQESSDIYMTEQTTALYKWMKHHYTSTVGSEYLGMKRAFGEINSSGIRNESLTELSFPDNSFDFILSFDVLEHIPDYFAAIQECNRVLRPGGQIIFSVPFSFYSDEHIVRALIHDDGSVEHLMEPEYHGDPINTAGCLCFYHFGWRLLDEFRKAGFDSVKALFYWSDSFSYLGLEQALFIAVKSVESPKS